MGHRQIHINKPIKILEWNANGIRRESVEFTYILQTHNIDIALISETKIPNDVIWRIPNYDIYRTEGPQRGQGGTAVIIKNSINHSPTNINGLIDIQLTAIDIYTDNRQITIGSVYVSPSKELTKTDLDTLTRHNNEFIFGGDFNAKNTEWNSRTNNRKGRTLLEHSTDEHYDVIGPTLPTHYHYSIPGQSDVLDIFIIKPTTTIITLDVLNELSSDHNPVLLEIDINCRQTFRHEKLNRTTNWALYRQILNKDLPATVNIQTKEELDIATQIYTDTLREAYNDATTTKITEKLTETIPDLQAIIQEKRRVRKRWQRHRRQIDKQYLNYITRRIKQHITDYKMQQIDKDIKTAVDKNNFWPVLKRFTNHNKKRKHPIHGLNGLVYESIDKANAMAETLERQFKSRNNDTAYETFQTKTRRQVKQYLKNQTTYDIPLIRPTEIKKILTKLKDDKAPGPDKIPIQAIKQIPKKGLTHMTKIFNTSLLLKHFPEPFKKAHIVTIPKPKKNPIFPQNYRPISLLNHIGKYWKN